MPKRVEPPVAAAPAVTFPRPLRWALTAWIVFHFTAVVIAPASVDPSSTLLQERVWPLVRPYLQLVFLNHGYHYFAPEPGPSTLLSYTLEWDDGRTEQGMIPNRGIHPRLLYHRYFMLTEFLNFIGLGLDPDAPQDSADPADPADPAAQAEQGQWLRAYARHLCHAHGANSVVLTRVVRTLPTMEEVRDGMSLADPQHVTETPLGTFRCDEL
jgi:hypothetical protein